MEKIKCNQCIPYLTDIISRREKEPNVTDVQLNQFNIMKPMLACRIRSECGVDALLSSVGLPVEAIQTRNGTL